MTHKVLPHSVKDVSVKKTLSEDEDQGEMDVVFFLTTTFYASYLLSIDWLYNETDAIAVNRFHLIVSNVWSFYPIMQAQGLWLKSLLLLSGYFSLVWHWSSDLKMGLPTDPDIYGRGDMALSIITIISYCLSWIPKIKVTEPTQKGCFQNNCLGRAKETAEWRCRWTLNLVINIVICLVFGSILYITWDGDDMHQIQILLCWIFISVALISALYQLWKGDLRVGKNRHKFAFWVAFGTLFGIISFVFKMKEGFNGHSLWHVFVMSCAYCFSRASEYLEIY